MFSRIFLFLGGIAIALSAMYLLLDSSEQFAKARYEDEEKVKAFVGAITLIYIGCSFIVVAVLL